MAFNERLSEFNRRGEAGRLQFPEGDEKEMGQKF